MERESAGLFLVPPLSSLGPLHEQYRAGHDTWCRSYIRTRRSVGEPGPEMSDEALYLLAHRFHWAERHLYVWGLRERAPVGWLRPAEPPARVTLHLLTTHWHEFGVGYLLDVRQAQGDPVLLWDEGHLRGTPPVAGLS